MEIKKGVSQMAEYPNVEISYVVPKSGNMYYLVKDGVLANGVIIATLDPKHAIDVVNPCTTVGAFMENGDTLIDFDKEDVKVINDNLLLAVNSNPTSKEVLDAVAKQNDETAKEEMLENSKAIEAKIMEEMGEGEIIFSDPFKEVSIYATDSYNNKLGIDCSVVGKNDKGLYLHTNNIDSDTVKVQIQNNTGYEETAIPQIDETPVENDSNVDDIPEDEADGFNISEEELSNMSFDNSEDENEAKDEVKDESEETKDEKIEEDKDDFDDIEEDETDDEEDDDEDEDDSKDELDEEKEEIDEEEKENEVFDNAIELINKYMDEANKLNDRIKELEEKEKEQKSLIESQKNTIENQKDTIKKNEEKIAEQERSLNEQEVKKDELNSILSKANEVLRNIK